MSIGMMNEWFSGWIDDRMYEWLIEWMHVWTSANNVLQNVNTKHITVVCYTSIYLLTVASASANLSLRAFDTFAIK